jgi:iron complex outermembrane receptor protein
LVDIGSLPLDGLDRVEVYRGHVPVEFGGATIGGAVNLVSAPVGDEPRMVLRGGYGSFGARQAGAEVRVPLPRGFAFSTAVGYAGALGDFPYYDTAGTPLDPDDDETTQRLNNQYDRVTGQMRLDGDHGKWRWLVRPFVTWKSQGIPGPASAQSTDSGLTTFDGRTILKASRRQFGHPGGRLEWLASVGAQQRVFQDPLNEIGFSVDDQRTVAVDAYLSPRVRLALWPGAFLRLMADQRTEHVDVDERGFSGTGEETTGDTRRLRLAWGAGVQLEQFLFERRWLIVPIFRVDALDSRFRVPTGTGEQDDRGQDQAEVGFSPRLGTRLRIVRGLELRASGGRYFRPPTLLELFGDRGYVIGNEGLAAENGWAVDGGLVFDRRLETRRGGPLTLYGQAAGFGTWTENLIQWVQTGTVVQPINIAGARLAGVETSLAINALWRAIVLQANYTFLDSVNLSESPSQTGQPLPGRPRHELYGRATTGWEWSARRLQVEPRAFYTAELISGTFLDASARVEVPTRAIHGVGVELHLARRVHFAFEVRNLLDTRVTRWNPPVGNATNLPVPVADFIGYPLPGRSFWATLKIDTELRTEGST